MHLSELDRLVWAASFLGQILILLVIFARRRARSFPMFTIYIACEIANTIALFLVYSHLSLGAYQYSYWSLSILDELLQLFVFYEIAVHVFCPTGVWAQDVRRAFLCVAGASVAIALLLAALAHPPAPRLIQAFVLRSNFFCATLMSELFVGMVVLSATAGLPWKTHVARIAQGLGAYSMVCVGLGIVANFVGLDRGAPIYRELAHLRTFTYLACESYWIALLWKEAPAPRELTESVRSQIYSLQRQVEGDLIKLRAWRRN